MAVSGHFPTTTWTLVLSAGQKTDAQSSEALAALCEKYWYPLYAYIRRRGYPVEQAQDLTQEFLAAYSKSATSNAPTAGRAAFAPFSFLP